MFVKVKKERLRSQKGKKSQAKNTGFCNTSPSRTNAGGPAKK